MNYNSQDMNEDWRKIIMTGVHQKKLQRNYHKCYTSGCGYAWSLHGPQTKGAWTPDRYRVNVALFWAGVLEVYMSSMKQQQGSHLAEWVYTHEKGMSKQHLPSIEGRRSYILFSDSYNLWLSYKAHVNKMWLVRSVLFALCSSLCVLWLVSAHLLLWHPWLTQ